MAESPPVSHGQVIQPGFHSCGFGKEIESGRIADNVERDPDPAAICVRGGAAGAAAAERAVHTV